MAEKVSLRFPDSKDVGGLFDGNDPKSQPLSYLTTERGRRPIIPQPSQKELDDAQAKTDKLGVDPNTGLPYQPKWVSVLIKRQPPWFFFRWACFNCFCQPRCTLTRAQWIWFCNLICAIVHGDFTYLCLSEGIPKAEKMEAKIWRISTRWNNTGVDNYVPTLMDNGSPIRIDLVAGGFFGLSALFHSMVVLFGPFDRFIFISWRQLDLAFFWWRW